MAQSRPSGRPSGGPTRKPGGKPTGGSATNRPAAKPSSTPRPGTRPPRGTSAPRPPARKPGKSIVNQRQTPWLLISITAVLVLFAGGIVAYAVTRSGSSTESTNAGQRTKDDPNGFYHKPEIGAAKSIRGLIFKIEPNHSHTTGLVKYDASPPVGGNHNPYWADCTGTVYDHQIANENAVHMLEHGAIWITYNPKLPKAEVAALAAYVKPLTYTALSPYAGLKTPISLQAWGYQLFLQKASDPRIKQFVDALRQNPETAPEYGSACSGSGFVAKDSYPGHPYVPAGAG